MKILLFLAFLLPFGQSYAMLTINGAGATFPYPIYSKWFAEYGKKNPNVRFNYQSIGSGGGVQQVLAGTVDFGASDVPMLESEEKKASHTILHVPTVLGAVAIVYNLVEVRKDLKLTGELLAKIYTGQISKWNDPLIQDLNKDLKLPAKNILVVHRSDGSGTSAVFTEYLSLTSETWKKNVGFGKAVKWPTGIGGKGNEGVTGIVKQTEGSIGYIEMAYAVQNHLSVAALKNKEGVFQSPTMPTMTSAAKILEESQSEKTSVINATGRDTYPLTSTTYLLIPLSVHTGDKLKGLKDFLSWALTDGQEMAAQLHYAPLPMRLREKMKKKIQSL